MRDLSVLLPVIFRRPLNVGLVKSDVIWGQTLGAGWVISVFRRGRGVPRPAIYQKQVDADLKRLSVITGLLLDVGMEISVCQLESCAHLLAILLHLHSAGKD